MMKLFRSLLLPLFVLAGTTVSAQAMPGDEKADMADIFYAEGKIYVVIGVVTIIFIGIAIYLFMIERKIKKLEQAVKEKN